MCSDISRTWICGDVEPNAEQKRIYQIAYEHIITNMELIRPGVSFEEITQKAHRLPKNCRANRYGVLMHGVGLCDEYPAIRYPEDIKSYGYQGTLEAGMVICVEAYVGEAGGSNGVKLEDQILVTEDGFDNMTHFPFEDAFLR
jgi:Xaa-Pro aminopeptidase